MGKKRVSTVPAPLDDTAHAEPAVASPEKSGAVSKKRKRTTVVDDASSAGPSSSIPVKAKTTDSDDDSSSASDSADSDSDSESESNANDDEDVPVLSHAALRKERKKQKKTGDEGAEDASAPSKSSSSKPNPKEASKRQNSVWVGNLAFKTTTQQLEEFFQEAGGVTRINMPTKNGGAPGRNINRGFAYVDFATPEAKATAITFSEKNLDGRKLLIKDGDDFAGRPIPSIDPSLVTLAVTPNATGTSTASGPTPGLSKFAQKVLRTQKQPPGPTLFMGNLGFEATAESVRAMIEAHQKVREEKLVKGKKKGEEANDEGKKEEPKEASLKKVRMGTFEDSGLCKGFAFLDFLSPHHATAALIDPRNYHLDGRDLKLEFASANAIQRGASKSFLKSDTTKSTPSFKPKRPQNEGEAEGKGEDAREPPAKRVKKEKKSRDLYPSAGGGGGGHRQKPGAALASAQREKVGIVEAQGKKIVFD